MTLLQINTTACDGSDVFWIWILWLIIAFVLGIILGRLLKGGSGNSGAAVAPTSGGPAVKQDLTKIEGIGPKIEKLLNDAGINGYHQLSQTPLSKLQQILEKGDPAYQVHHPITWSAQARLADENQWDELKKWQDLLKSGV